jgi:transposase-like protein
MPRKKHTPEQIIAKLREAEVEISKGATVPIACRKIGVTEQTYYRWRREFGGLKVDQAKRLKDLERENARLKRLVAELSLDKVMLEDIAKGNF